MKRRTFLKGMVAAAAATSPFDALAGRRRGGPPLQNPDYGPLQPTIDQTTGLPLLALPEGFSYFSMSWTGDPMMGGGTVPSRHDGGAVLLGPPGLLHYVRNHERTSRTPFAESGSVYDDNAGGGTTTIVFDPNGGRYLGTFPSLSGTIRNCAGGRTPWNSWLSCEETLDGPGQGLNEPHGYVFEVPSLGPVDPRPLPGLGRFVHEAVAVNPWTGIVYLTEDRGNSGLYRFIPNRYGHLREGGLLEMLRIVDLPKFQTGQGLADGSTFDVDWVPIADPENAPYAQGAEQGGASFRRGEGIWYGRNRIEFCATSGGAAGAGQVWRLDPFRDVLELLYESPSSAVLNHPDNITLSYRSGGAVLCEDGSGSPMYVRGLSRDGEIFDLVRNDLVLNESINDSVGPGNYRDSEFAGAAFSPAGRWLFLSIQTPGVTFAIRGPWRRGPLF